MEFEDLLSSNNKNCMELLILSKVMEKGLWAPLGGISEEHLNYSLAPHKMSIGQIAIHSTAWARYFLSPKDDKPWEITKWTCRPVDYPLTLSKVKEIFNDGFKAIQDDLSSIDDDLLEVDVHGEKGHGYIIYRLLIHVIAHGNQMAYLRQGLDPEWKYGTHFGDMATAVIAMKYRTDRDLSIGGF